MAIHGLLKDWPDILKAYTYVLLLDDNLHIRESEIGELFAIAEEADLDLAQPSLSPIPSDVTPCFSPVVDGACGTSMESKS